MRQPQQKSRSRGRGRKQQNPLSRNYESNGPDVKIRGNAGHIADKYSSLARDALSNGDTVMAENYLQHAEHYNRIVASAQSQHAARQEENQNANGRDGQNQSEQSAAETADASENSEANAKANGNAVEETSAEAEKPARQTRRRKPRSAEDASDEKPQTEDGPGSEETASDDEVIAAKVSDDAAKLPGSITGALAAEEG